MAPRADDDTPRRGESPRRGSSRDVPGAAREEGAEPRRRSSISEARAYTPRGRTVAERGRTPRTDRTGDPFRPALQVLDGGDTPQRGRGRGARAPEPAATTPRRSERPEPEQAEEPRGRAARVARETRDGAPARTPKEARGGRAGAEGRTGREARPRRSASEPRPPKAPRRRPIPAEPPKLANSVRRLRLGTVLALALFVIIGARLVVLQVATSPEEAQSLVKLRERRLTTQILPAPRGRILDRDGNVLVQSVSARYVSADPENPNLRKDVKGIAAKLSPILGIPQSELIENMGRTKAFGEWVKFRFLARGVDTDKADQIDALNLPGIYTARDERRVIPQPDLAANLIGFVGSDRHGLEGLEARYDDVLFGQNGRRVFEVGAGKLNKAIPGGYERYTPPKPGNSLQLTIDEWLQDRVQGTLETEARAKNAAQAGAVVIDVATGEILAQASYPSYLATKPGDYKPTDRIDVPTSVVTDPGSVHKALVFGAALQEKKISKDQIIPIGPAIKKGDTTFEDLHPYPKGTPMTLAGLMAHSSNVGTILIADMLGKEKLYEYQLKFGLGQKTGAGPLGESAGLLRKPNDWDGSSYGSVPLGMSVSATLMQMAAAYATIANDGVYIQPQLIKATISGKDEKVTPAPAPKTHRVLDAEVAAELRTIMEAVVADGTGTNAAVNSYRVAGKTGTGGVLENGVYTNYNASSFIGMAPAEDPRYVIAVSMAVPKGTGGEVSAPAFKEMMAYTLTKYRVPASTTKPPKLKLHP